MVGGGRRGRGSFSFRQHFLPVWCWRRWKLKTSVNQRWQQGRASVAERCLNSQQKTKRRLCEDSLRIRLLFAPQQKTDSDGGACKGQHEKRCETYSWIKAHFRKWRRSAAARLSFDNQCPSFCHLRAQKWPFTLCSYHMSSPRSGGLLPCLTSSSFIFRLTVGSRHCRVGTICTHVVTKSSDQCVYFVPWK